MANLKTGSRTRNSILNIISSFGGELLLIVLRFITRTVFIHTLGKQYLGINGLFSDILTMLSLTELGLDTAINFKLYKPLAENDEKRVRVLIKFYKQVYRVIGVSIFILGLFLVPLLPFLIRDYDSLETLGINAVLVFILYLSQSAASYLFFAYRSAIMKANQKRYVLDFVNYAVNICSNIIQIIVLVVLKDFIIYTATSIAFVIIRNIIDAIIAKKYYPHFFVNEEESLEKHEIIDLFKDCGALFVYKLNSTVIKATDNIVISKFLGLSFVALYSNYLLLYATCRSLIHRIYEAIKASMGNLFATSDTKKKYEFYQTMNLLTFVLYGTAGVGIAVCSNELVGIWISKDYCISFPFSALIGCEVLFSGMRNNLGQIRNVSGAFRQSWYRPILSVIVNLLVSIILVNVCGLYGVIIGTLVSTITTNFVFDPYIIHKYSFNSYKPVMDFYKKNAIYFLTLISICSIDIVICNNLLVGHGWLSFVIHVVICGLSVPLCFFIAFRKTEEGKYLIGIFKKIIKKIKGA